MFALVGVTSLEKLTKPVTERAESSAIGADGSTLFETLPPFFAFAVRA